MTTPLEHSKNAFLILTSMTNDDFKSSSKVIDELLDADDREAIHGLVAALAAAFYGVCVFYAADTGADPTKLRETLLRNLATATAMSEGESP